MVERRPGMEPKGDSTRPWELKEVQCSGTAESGRAGKVGVGVRKQRPDPGGLESLVSYNVVLRSVAVIVGFKQGRKLIGLIF